jgi:hypothetical protein
MDSPVAHQTRVVRIFHDMRTFAIGTVEGRVAVRYLDPKTDTETEPGTRDRLKYSFSFRCHRHGAQNVLVYPVNCIDAHPREGYHVRSRCCNATRTASEPAASLLLLLLQKWRADCLIRATSTNRPHPRNHSASRHLSHWEYRFRAQRLWQPSSLVRSAIPCRLNASPIVSQDVFATAGSDGTFVFWNKTKKLKLKEYLHMQQ